MLGNTRRLAALIAFLCLAVAGVATQAQGQNGVQHPAVTNQGGYFFMDGKPYFPVMWQAPTWCPDEQTLNNIVSIGVNTIYHDSYGCTFSGNPTDETNKVAASVANRNLWWYERNPASNPPFLQTMFQNLPTYLDWQTDAAFTIDANAMLGCNSSSSLGAYNAVRRDVTARGVVYLMILADRLTPSYKSCLTGPRLATLFWTVMVSGAGGVVYSTDLRWLDNDTQQFAVKDDVQAQARKQNAQAGSILSILSTPAFTERVKGAPAVRATARRFGGSTYILAVNTAEKTAKASFSAPRKTGKAQLPWEHRLISVTRGTFSDNFGPGAVHFYKLSGV